MKAETCCVPASQIVNTGMYSDSWLRKKMLIRAFSLRESTTISFPGLQTLHWPLLDQKAPVLLLRNDCLPWKLSTFLSALPMYPPH